MSISLIIFIVFLVLCLVIFVLVMMLRSKNKTIAQKDSTINKLEKEVAWTIKKYNIHTEVKNEAEKEKQKLNSGSDSDRFNGATDVMRNTNRNNKGNTKR